MAQCKLSGKMEKNQCLIFLDKKEKKWLKIYFFSKKVTYLSFIVFLVFLCPQAFYASLRHTAFWVPFLPYRASMHPTLLPRVMASFRSIRWKDSATMKQRKTVKRMGTAIMDGAPTYVKAKKMCQEKKTV